MGKHSKKHKKSKMSKKYKSSDSSDEWVEAELIDTYKKKTSKRKLQKKHSNTSSDESSSEEQSSKRKRNRRYSSSSSTSNDSMSRRTSPKKSLSKSEKYSSNESLVDETLSKEPSSFSSSKNKYADKSSDNEQSTTKEREEWMSLSSSLSSFTNSERRKQREEVKKLDRDSQIYNPSTCSRELNPYWKDGGSGLPTFRKPNDSDEEITYKPYKKSNNESGWRKKQEGQKNSKSNTSNNPSNIPSGEDLNKPRKEVAVDANKDVITEKELNLLAGKLVKAEIMGNDKLVKELKEKLNTARKALEIAKSQDQDVLLTQTDNQGRSRPLTLQPEYDQSYGGKKQKKKAVNTHQSNQRVKYFPDDDKYSLKQMFENEKYNTTRDQDREFMNVASKIRKNDDLDDLFTDNVRRESSSTAVKANTSKAISDHQTISDKLDNCTKCIQSSFMEKHLIVSMGEYVYLALPSHEPLTTGHCLIVPIRHVTCVTQLDENEWNEILNFRKALVRLFASKNECVVFFEIAIYLHKYPHMVLECVPLPREEGDMAPIYFKKAIDESETEWSQNKKLVSLKDRGVRRAIPKGLSYFFVSFGMEEGFAHVIEDEKLFPRNFAQEVIGGMLDLHHSKWRRPKKQAFNDQSKRVLKFSKEWEDFDCTKVS